MKVLNIFLAVFIFSNIFVWKVLADQKVGSISLLMHGLENNEGVLQVALDKKEESFDSKNDAIPSYRRVAVVIVEREGRYIFENIPYGEYAIKIYHDENNNGKLDFNKLGIPTEPYGFSNNARAMFGPPKFKKAKFVLDEIKIHLKMKVK